MKSLRLPPTSPKTDELWKKQTEYQKKAKIPAFFAITSGIVFFISFTLQAGEFTFIKNLPSKANLAITILSFAIFVVSCIVVLVLDKKEHDLWKNVSDEHLKVVNIGTSEGLGM